MGSKSVACPNHGGALPPRDLHLFKVLRSDLQHLGTVLSAGRQTGVAVMCNLPARGGCVVTALAQRVFMNTLGFQEEIDMKLGAPAATDEALVAAARLGNHAAFAELWTRHSNAAFKMAYRIVGNRDDAEDVIQDAWMKAYVHLRTFGGRSKFSTWLIRITINSALMTLRRKRVHPETSMEVEDGESRQNCEIVDPTEDVEDFYARCERAESLRRAICRLRPTLRNVIEIHQLNDRSVKEIAELAGISVAATKSRLLRARTILRRALG